LYAFLLGPEAKLLNVSRLTVLSLFLLRSQNHPVSYRCSFVATEENLSWFCVFKTFHGRIIDILRFVVVEKVTSNTVFETVYRVLPSIC